ncbi:hypothetical protein KKB10_02180 [Patescibacteria group bacterium]|nr:hypothetical protein [Patescibacteria group bacterium]MBU1952339.1 hypothetical protein [Patescibacteria group bacterium]
MLNQKGLTPVVAAVIIVLILAITGGGIWYIVAQNDSSETTSAINSNSKIVNQNTNEEVNVNTSSIKDSNLTSVSTSCLVDDDCTLAFTETNKYFPCCTKLPNCTTRSDDRWISVNNESFESYLDEFESNCNASPKCPVSFSPCYYDESYAQYEAQCIDGRCLKVEEESTVNTNTVVIDSSGTDDWQTYTNNVYGYTLNYPPDWDIIEMSTNENVYWTDETGQSTLSTRIRSEYPTWFDNSADSVISLGGINGNRFIYQYCDGPSCGSETVADVVPVAEQYLGLEFLGDQEIDSTEEKVRASFQFTE